MAPLNQITFNFANISELAIIITIVGYVVVFIALAALVIVIGQIANIQQFFIRMKVRATRKEKPGTEPAPVEVSLSADQNAAICTALWLYFNEQHDDEKYVMTVKKVSRTYSPWSSKIYGVMDLDRGL